MLQTQKYDEFKHCSEKFVNFSSHSSFLLEITVDVGEATAISLPLNFEFMFALKNSISSQMKIQNQRYWWFDLKVLKWRCKLQVAFLEWEVCCLFCGWLLCQQIVGDLCKNCGWFVRKLCAFLEWELCWLFVGGLICLFRVELVWS